LQCDGVVEEELRSGFEDIGDSISREVLIEGRGEIAEDEANVFDWDLEGDGGQKRECIVSTNSYARDGTIDDDDGGSNRFDVFLNLSGDTFHVEFVLSTISSIGQPRCVENADLKRRLRISTVLTYTWYLQLRHSCS